jgi:hypothetical protein
VKCFVTLSVFTVRVASISPNPQSGGQHLVSHQQVLIQYLRSYPPYLEAIPPSAQNLLSSSLLSKNVKIKIYRTIILPVVLYGCESWSLTLREECRLRVFENKVLRRIFGPKRDEVTGEWRRLHNKELFALYSSPNIIRVIKSRRLRWAGHVARMGERRGAYRALLGKPEGRRPLGRPRRRWEDNVKMFLREVAWGGHRLGRSGSGQGEVESSCECDNEPSHYIKCGEFLD